MLVTSLRRGFVRHSLSFPILRFLLIRHKNGRSSSHKASQMMPTAPSIYRLEGSNHDSTIATAHSTSYHDWAVWDGGLFKKDSRRLSYILHMPQATTTLQKLSRLVLPDRACVDKNCDKHMAADNKQKVGDTLICRRTWWWESLESWNYVWHVECRRKFHKEPRSTKYCVGRASQGYSSSNLSPPISLGDLRPAR